MENRAHKNYRCQRQFIIDQRRSSPLPSPKGGGGKQNIQINIKQKQREDGLSPLDYDRIIQNLKEREADLNAAEKRYQTLVENLPAIMYIAPTEGVENLIYVSPQIKAILGYEPDEWKDDWLDKVHPEDRIRLIEEIDRAKTEQEKIKTEYRVFNSSGKVIWLRNEAVKVSAFDGESCNWQGFLIDINEQKTTQASLEEYADQLERSNQELQDFAYIASHDLQEPLRKIQAFSERLLTKYADRLDDRGKYYIERMDNSASRLQGLINDLLSYSRVSTRARPGENVNLSDVVKNVVSDLEILINEKQANIEIGDLPVIEADIIQMRQVFQNLIGNAIKFNRKGEKPVIKISSVEVRPNSGWVRILVEDNGIGFEEKYTKRIFQPFQRLHGRDEYQGSGIGLAVVRKIIERHHGVITARSTPGEGSTFIITLPIKQDRDTIQRSKL